MENISIIFQGRVLDEGKICSGVMTNIATTRRQFPDDEIILSTWNLNLKIREELLGQLQPLKVRLVESQDPGPLVYQQKNARWITNVNRMIVSSRQGIRQARYELVIKLRTDSLLYQSDIRDILLRRQEDERNFPRDPEYALFRQRVINGNVFARNARGHMPYLFHPGDIFLAGNREDLLDLFDIPLADSSVFEVCFCFSIFSLMRYVPEQYLWVRYIEKIKGRVEFPGNAVFTETLRERSEKYYVSNFIPYSSEQLGFRWSKHQRVYKNKGLSSVYRLEDWRNLQRSHLPSRKNRDIFYKVRTVKVFILRLLLWVKFLPLHFAFVRAIAIRVYGRRC